MNIIEITNYINHKATIWSSRSHKAIDIPFEISPEDYLEFAEEDFKVKDIHSMVNALSNAKRAIDCRIDSLLIVFGIYQKAKKSRWGVQRKIEEIVKYGIVAPRVLKKINSVRNLVEHEFIKPEEEQVSDFIDIVSLFLSSTEKYIYDFPIDAELENDEIDETWLDFRFDYENNIIKIRVVNKQKDNVELSLNMASNDSIDFFRAYLGVTTRYN